MTYKQIKEIKANHDGITLNTHLCNMFNNKEWATTWTIKFMTERDIKKLMKYLDDNDLNYFFGKSGIHIQ